LKRTTGSSCHTLIRCYTLGFSFGPGIAQC
jgi:hypothetical protein